MITCRSALVDGTFRRDVAIEVTDGVVTKISSAEQPTSPPDVDGVVVPGFVNTHSHLFHRALRGGAHGEDFWNWRTTMYQVAERLDPDRYHELALGVFGEMLDAGYTSVGEFHYLHHRPDGSRYPHHEMELAVAEAARQAGIRLTLLDTCYLHGGFGQPLEAGQKRFGDGSVEAWLQRWHELADALPADPRVRLGAALHSVRAVALDELHHAIAGLPADVPVHVHVSEQPAENRACQEATGLTPTTVLERAGVLSARTTVVHATHLSDEDLAMIAHTGTTVSLCPTTEADLADGIPRTADLVAAGVPLAIGSDENVVTDPFAELRMIESGVRLSSGRRGVVSNERLWGSGAQVHSVLPELAAVDPQRPGLRVGDPADMVAISPDSAQLAGVDPLRWPLTASEADVTATIVAGQRVPSHSPAMLRSALHTLFKEDS